MRPCSFARQLKVATSLVEKSESWLREGDLGPQLSPLRTHAHASCKSLHSGIWVLSSALVHLLRCARRLDHPTLASFSTLTTTKSELRRRESVRAMYRSNARQTGANEAPLAAQRRWGGGGGGGGPPPPDGGPGRGDDYSSGGYGGQNGGSHGRDDYGRGPPPPQQRDSYGGYDDRGRPSSSSRFDDRGGGGGGGGPAFDDRGRPMSAYSYGHGPGGPMQPPPPPPPLGSESPAPTGERKRKSRWGDKQEGAMPVAITGGVQEKDLESYARTCDCSPLRR